jgi:TorA maturation chaperone TorD
MPTASEEEACMSPMSTAAPEVERTLCRGMLYELLAMCMRPPGGGFPEALRAAAARRKLGEAAAALEGGEGKVAAALEDLLRAAGEAGELDLAHQRLFGHTARGLVPPYETEYGSSDPFLQSQEMADIGGFYRAFGLTLEGDRRERNDHLSVELEFLSFLCLKEAHHALRGDAAFAEEVRKAARAFLRDHPGRFGRAFASSLAREAGHPFYRAVGGLFLAFLEAECRRLDLHPGPEFIPLRPAEEREVPMACGSCPLREPREGDPPGPLRG